jgi:hypothetical protein
VNSLAYNITLPVYLVFKIAINTKTSIFALASDFVLSYFFVVKSSFDFSRFCCIKLQEQWTWTEVLFEADLESRSSCDDVGESILGLQASKIFGISLNSAYPVGRLGSVQLTGTSFSSLYIKFACVGTPAFGFTAHRQSDWFDELDRFCMWYHVAESS